MSPVSYTHLDVYKRQVIEPADGLDTHDYETAGRLAGLKAAARIGEAGRNITPDEVVSYETKALQEQIKQYPDLQRFQDVYKRQHRM